MNSSLRHQTRYFLAAIFLVVSVTLPAWLGSYGIYLVTELFIWALLAMSLDLLLGYTNLPSFGHAVFFGVPAYTFGVVLLNTNNVWFGCLAAFLAVLSIALIIGFFAVRTGGAGFIIVTLLASLSAFSLVMLATNLTGGENGLLIPKDKSFAVMPPAAGYFIVLGFFVSLYLFSRRLVRSNFGIVLLAIKANEARTEAMGYNVRIIKIYICVISAVMAGIAGVLYAVFARTLSAELVGPALSTEIVIWVLLGGVQTIFGPIVGAVLFVSIKQVLSDTSWWPMFLGLLFVAVVLYAPQGLVSVLHRGKRNQVR